MTIHNLHVVAQIKTFGIFGLRHFFFFDEKRQF